MPTGQRSRPGQRALPVSLREGAEDGAARILRAWASGRAGLQDGVGSHSGDETWTWLYPNQWVKCPTPAIPQPQYPLQASSKAVIEAEGNDQPQPQLRGPGMSGKEPEKYIFP